MHLKAIFSSLRNPENDQSEDEIRARLAKLKGIPEAAISSSSQNVLVSKPVKPSPLQEKDLLEQMQAEIELEKNMPDPDEELEQRLARLKGVDVETVRHPGKGLDKQPTVKTEPEIDPEAFLHDHSNYIIRAPKNVTDEDLNKEITGINKEVSRLSG